jgi:hypothetical protein
VIVGAHGPREEAVAAVAVVGRDPEAEEQLQQSGVGHGARHQRRRRLPLLAPRQLLEGVRSGQKKGANRAARTRIRFVFRFASNYQIPGKRQQIKCVLHVLARSGKRFKF